MSTTPTSGNTTIVISSRRKRNIRVRSHRYGTIQLRSLSFGDLIFLEEIIQLELPAREFTAQVIHNQIVLPKFDRDNVRDWTDKLLIRVAREWTIQEGEITEEAHTEIASFDMFQQMLVDYVDRTHQKFAEAFAQITADVKRSITQPLLDQFQQIAQNATLSLAESFRRQTVGVVEGFARAALQPILESITESGRRLAQMSLAVDGIMQNIATSLIPRFEIGQLFPQLPDLVELFRQRHEIQQARNVLDENGYGFAEHLWDTAFVRSFSKHSSRSRNAGVTNKLLNVTRNGEFETELNSLVTTSSTLQHRSKIIARALNAHRNRDYIVSVPLFLSQLEGIIGDALILKGMVISKRGKLYKRGMDGKMQLGRDGKPIELKGLGPLVQHSDFRNHDVLKFTVDLLTSELVPDRNIILHGRQTAYGKAKLSTQLLLLIFVFTSEVIAFELGRTSS